MVHAEGGLGGENVFGFVTIRRPNMTRNLLIVSSFLLAGASPLATAADSGGEGPPTTAGVAIWNADVRVPLPVARPGWAERQTGVRLVAQSGSTSETRVPPSPEGKGLKSGSAEALAVQLEGAKVVSSEGDVVGQVEKVIDEPGTGRHAVVVIGGFLGIGGSSVLVPTETLAPSGSGMVRTELSQRQLRSLPAYNR